MLKCRAGFSVTAGCFDREARAVVRVSTDDHCERAGKEITSVCIRHTRDRSETHRDRKQSSRIILSHF